MAITAPDRIRNGKEVTVEHSWANLGWGYCPNNLKQWNYKYKVAFAILDQDGKVVAEFIDRDSEPSEWIEGKETAYSFGFVPSGIPAGKYTLAVGIVDTSKADAPVGIELAVDESLLSGDGWVKVKEIILK